jgi:predicted ATPase/class 3 adenylate cyclase
MPAIPTGTVTFFFSDIEGSTRLLSDLGHDAFGTLLDAHAAVIRAAIAEGDGTEIRTEGDAFFAAFPTATGALAAAVGTQRGLAAHPWPDGATIRVRIGLHTGEGSLGGDDYLGIDVNKAARIAATGHGGQVVLSATTAALTTSDLPAGVALRGLGSHLLKDFAEPEDLHDVAIDGLDDAFPPLRTLDPRRTVLPSTRTSFVGREPELVAVAAAVTSSRLTTLTGPGGTGKTRIAVEAATAVQHRFADGVVFVDLSAITDPALVAAEIGSALRMRPGQDTDPTAALHAYVADLRLLLVLDNMEQLVDGGDVVTGLLDAAPNLTVLATSRIPLRLAGEREVPVPPLSLPEPDDASLDELASVESISLFLDRAREARPGFRLDAANARAVVDIVSRLDALPLAIELAAAKLRVLDPETLAARLEQRLPMLTGGPRDAPERHRTLAASIRWSVESLDEATRRLFRGLSVFAGGWTLEAAEEVLGADVDVLDGLTTLVESSLVRRSGDEAAELRFSMLETIREYAAAELDEAEHAERDGLHRRHTATFRALAETSERHLTGEHQLEWLDRIGREHDNVRVALERAERTAGPEDVRDALVTATSIWRFWQQRGHMAEARGRLERLLALPAAAERDVVRARALGALGSLDYWMGDYPTMAERYREAVDIARELDDPRLLSEALLNLSFEWFLSGDPNDAIPRLEECLAIADERDVTVRARAHMSIGYTHFFQQDIASAQPQIARAVELLRASDERLARCEALVSLAGVDWLMGNQEPALTAFAEAMEIALGAPSPMLLAQIVYPSQILLLHTERYRDAAVLQGVWERLEQDFEVTFPGVGTSLLGDPVIATREALGEDAFADAAAIGRAMDLEEMVGLLAALQSVNE